MIMIRTLRRDIARYNKEEEMVKKPIEWKVLSWAEREDKSSNDTILFNHIMPHRKTPWKKLAGN